MKAERTKMVTQWTLYGRFVNGECERFVNGERKSVNGEYMGAHEEHMVSA